MRIAFFSDNFYPEISGISDSIITTGEALRAKGHEVVYVAPHYYEKAHQPVTKKLAKHENPTDQFLQSIHRLPSLPLPNSPTGQSHIAIPVGTSIPFLFRFKPDVIHTQSPFGAGLEALLASRILGIPLVGTNHTPIEEYVPKSLKWFARRHFSWYYNRCAFVTTPFDGLLSRMREAGFTQPAQAQPNPVHLGVFTSISKEDRARLRLEEKFVGPTLLYSGRLANEKRIDVLIRALARLRSTFPNIELVIAGKGSAESSLKELARTLDVESRVRFLGFVVHARLARLCQGADAFVLMSTSETQSLSLMQAFASGLPAVVADAGALPFYTPPECGFLVPPGNVGVLVERLTTLLSDETLREKMGQSAVSYVQRFAPEKIAHEWEQVYSDAISSFSAFKTRSRIARTKK